jgi:hypothetical protein
MRDSPTDDLPETAEPPRPPRAGTRGGLAERLRARAAAALAERPVRRPGAGGRPALRAGGGAPAHDARAAVEGARSASADGRDDHTSTPVPAPDAASPGATGGRADDAPAPVPASSDATYGRDDDAPVRFAAPAADVTSSAAEERAAEEPAAEEPADEPADGAADGDRPPAPDPAREAFDGDDDPVDPPVIGCTRCDARVVMGSRYCPSCGTPLVRSGEQAAAALSRTRRPAPAPIRFGAPVVLVGALVATLLVVTHDPAADARGELAEGLGSVVDANRDLSARLSALRPGSSPAAAAAAARDADRTIAGVERRFSASDIASGETGPTSRARAAVAADGAYVDAVVAILENPRAAELTALGRRAARAVAALDAVDDIVDTEDAIAGSAALGAHARARAKASPSGASAAGSGGPAGKPRPAFVRDVDRAVADASVARTRVTRTFALLRAARDGVETWDGPGDRPASAAAAVDQAERELTRITASRATSAGRAREIDASTDAQREVTRTLATAFDAGAATARKLTGCIASFQNTAPDGVARQCLEGVKPLSATETRAVRAWAAAYRPVRAAAGLPAARARL